MARSAPALKSLIVGVHLDLKGVAPRPEYLLQLPADLATQGVNTLLVEYEDLFPFNRGIGVGWDKSARMSASLLKEFLAAAAEQNVSVIPLQQCLGHLEYVFRWPRYRQHAEDALYPSTLKLSDARGRQLVAAMLEQVMAAHPGSPYVHLGMDEAHGLVTSPRYRGSDLLRVFLDYLHELIAQVRAAGKTPIIWSDMLEDHFRPELLRRYRDQVILMPWDYAAVGARTTRCRMLGWRVSRRWLDRPDDPAAPPIQAGQQFIEDLPRPVLDLMRPHLHPDGTIAALFQVDLWTKLGFRVIGGSHVCQSADMSLLPVYPRVLANNELWARTIRRNGQMGLIATSWARGNSFCPPNCLFDATWPGIVRLAPALGKRVRPFWPGAPRSEVDRILHQLGRCRQDWQIESELADRMRKLSPRLRDHRYEWRSLELLARLLALHRRTDLVLAEMDYFRSGVRLVESQWKRRLADQRRAIADLRRMRRTVDTHFRGRYHGEAYREWLRHVFDGRIEDLRRQQRIARVKLALARKRFARGPS